MILKILPISFLSSTSPLRWTGLRQSRLVTRVDGMSLSTSSASATSSKVPVYPRAAVAVTLQSIPTTDVIQNKKPTMCSYLLVQRAKPPDQGKWSLPGGKIELGETTLAAGQRELKEETYIDAKDCRWCQHPFMTTDAIFYNDDSLAFHYVIAQCFAQVQGMPNVIPSDDALAASWWTLDNIRACAEDEISDGVITVVERAEDMFQKNALVLR